MSATDPPGASGESIDRIGDQLLQRMVRVEVRVDGPAVDPTRRKHPGVLSRTVLLQGRRFDALGPCRRSGGLAERSGGGVPQIFDGDVVPVEDLQHRVEVGALARMAGRDHGEQAWREIEPRLDHRLGLERLERRARVDGQFRVAERAGDRPVGRHDDARSVVQRLVDATARRHGDRREGTIREPHRRHAHGLGFWGTIFDCPGGIISVRWLSTTS